MTKHCLKLKKLVGRDWNQAISSKVHIKIFLKRGEKILSCSNNHGHATWIDWSFSKGVKILKGVIFSALIYLGKFFDKFWKRKYIQDFESALIGHGQFEISSEVLALCTYNVHMNGKFKVRLTQPLTVNEGKILPLERAGK